MVRRHRGAFLRTTFTGNKDADALDHLCGRGRPFGKKDIGAECAVEAVDGSRNDHSGETRVKLLGAAHELVAIHLWHQQIAEQEVNGAGQGPLDPFKSCV